jgi:hypothetical protein
MSGVLIDLLVKVTNSCRFEETLLGDEGNLRRTGLTVNMRGIQC